MGCSQYYRDCPKCGESVHMNFKCSCGGDPWFIDEERAERKEKLIQKRKEHLKAIEVIDNEIKSIKT